VSTGGGILAIAKPRTTTTALPKSVAAALVKRITGRPRLATFALDEDVCDGTGLRDREEGELLPAAGRAAVHVFTPWEVIDVA
jgi:hypothetical protein